MKRSAVLIFAGAMFFALAGVAQGGVTLHVDNHTNPATTRSLPDHLHTIQEAINLSVMGDVIQVVQGTYDENLVLDSLHGNHIPLLGGYRWDCAVRDPLVYPTTITGGGRDMSVIRIDGCTAPNTLIEGFTIRDGVGTQDTNGCYAGGGLLVTNSEVIIRNNIIRNNGKTTGPATNAGAGIYFNLSSGEIVGNQFIENTAFVPGTQYSHGGAIVLLRSSPLITRNTFKDNHAGETGGAIMTHFNCYPVIADNLFVGNSAVEKGAAVAAHLASVPEILNNTFYGNISSHGLTAMFDPLGQGGVIDLSDDSSATIANNIIAFNQAAGVSRDTTVLLPPIEYNDFYGNMGSSVPGGYAGVGNIFANPLFSSASSGDFHLKHSPLSPCIDAGGNSYATMSSAYADLDGKPRIWDTVVDIGCYESGSIPPYTTCSLAGAMGQNGWYLGSSVTVTLTATDGGLPLTGRTQWAYAGTSLWVNYSAPFGYLRGGSNDLLYRSTDLDGNVETVRSTTIKLDGAIPSLAITSPVGTVISSVSPVTFTGTASDLLSGLLSVRWLSSAMGSGACTGTTNWSASVPLAPGTQNITFRATDQAGNVRSVIRAAYLGPSDTTPPTVPAPPTGGKYTLPLVITFSEAIQQGSAFTGITIKDLAARKPVDLVKTRAINGNQLTLTATLSARKTYTVTLPAGCVKDLAGNGFAGLTFTYTTTR